MPNFSVIDAPGSGKGMQAEKFSLVIHGGAFSVERDYVAQELFLRDVLNNGYEMLRAGASALDVAVESVRMMEDSGLYVAGKGSAPNQKGYYELDASLMEGHTGRVGAVASLRRFQNPIHCARAVMEKSSQVFFVGEGAENFLLSRNMKPLPDPATYFKPVAKVSVEPVTGTVGAVALDRLGHLAAATSTGGLQGKPEGRVGDTPLIGAATWADDYMAVSTTGYGEYFIRAAAAHDAAARVRYGGQSLDTAVGAALARVKELGGWGGMIALDKSGTVKCGYTAAGMHYGWVGSDEKISLGV